MAPTGYQGPEIPSIPTTPLPANLVEGIPTSTNYPQNSTIAPLAGAGSPKTTGNVFPDPSQLDRLQRYNTNEKLWSGDHVGAFLALGRNAVVKDAGTKIAWMVCNYAGLISKVCADMLFGEPISIKMSPPDGDPKGDDASNEEGAEVTGGTVAPADPRQEFMDALIVQNKMHTKNYESALGNSRRGDALYKVRIGMLEPGDETTTVIIENINPAIYFPTLDTNNIDSAPLSETLAWLCTGTDGKTYLRKEIHTPGLIVNEAWLMEGNKIQAKADLSILGIPDLQDQEDTGINKSLLVHVPNWRDGSGFFGRDDYFDITSLMYSLDNRMTRIDRILEKHADPILTVPEGVLDEKGQVRQGALQMFEIPNSNPASAPSVPQYITWDASLEAAWKEIDKMMEMLYLFSEVTPDVFGMGSETVSGRALRLKLLRTIAKISRKRNYYDQALKQVLYISQLLAIAHDIGVGHDRDTKFVGEPEVPAIEWADGLPIDSYEAAQEEALRLESGTTTQKQAIMRLDGVDEETAIEIVAEIKEESKSPIPSIGSTVVFASGAKPPLPVPEVPVSPAAVPNESGAAGAKEPAKQSGR